LRKRDGKSCIYCIAFQAKFHGIVAPSRDVVTGYSRFALYRLSDEFLRCQTGLKPAPTIMGLIDYSSL